jgi:nickel-dependent lactate racemase
MNATIAFGKNELLLALPEGPRYEVIRARTAQPIADVHAQLRAALDAPIGCAPLIELASGKKSAAISVCDITRPAPNATTLPPLLERLHRASIGPQDVTIFIATGLHRAATEEEIEIILGVKIAAEYNVVNHDAKDFAAHRHLGRTNRGTPVHIEERFMAADLHISLGFIEQHLMLGFSGGRKLIAPGLAAQETIKVIHSPRFMREKMAIEGSVSENPLHDELLEIARMARHDFMLDVTLTRSREISGIFAGDPVKAHAAGVDFIRESSLEYLPEYVDAVITSAAGYPLDLTFYQTIKGITAAQHILRPGGKILVLGECTEGVGSHEFAKKVSEYRGPQEYLESIRQKPVDVDQWQLEKLALVELKHPVLLYTPGVSKDALGALGASRYESAESAVEALLSDLPKDARVAVIPDGPYTYARVGTMVV